MNHLPILSEGKDDYTTQLQQKRNAINPNNIRGMAWCHLCLNVDYRLTFYITTHGSSLISLTHCKGAEIWEALSIAGKE